MQVLMMPDYRPDNPYQILLAKALENVGITVIFPIGYRRGLPFLRAVYSHSEKSNVLHLHWLTPYLKGSSCSQKWFYAIKLLVDICIVRLSGVRVVWTIHNLVAHDVSHARLDVWVRKCLSKIVNQLIVHNNSSKEIVVKFYRLHDSKVSVIPIGHYRGVYSEPIESLEARQLLSLPLTGNIYLWQGILRPYKGVEFLLKTWSEHETLFRGHTLLIAGKALDDAYGKHIAKLAHEIKGTFLSLEFIDDDKLHLFFSATTIVVLPFQKILTSSSLVLAMSYCKPVIAPRLGGIPETVGEANWLLYEPSDEQGLFNALKESMQVDLPALTQLVKQSCDLLDWDNIGKKTKCLYQTVSGSIF